MGSGAWSDRAVAPVEGDLCLTSQAVFIILSAQFRPTSDGRGWGVHEALAYSAASR